MLLVSYSAVCRGAARTEPHANTLLGEQVCQWIFRYVHVLEADFINKFLPGS